MNFSQLHERLRLEIWRRIDRGMLTSGLLARQAGLRPSHISNFLHRKRRLSLPALDRVLSSLLLDIDDLSAADIARSSTNRRADFIIRDSVPLVSFVSAFGSPTISEKAVLEVIPLPPGLLDSFRARRVASRRHWQRFVAVRLVASQSLPMEPVLKNNSIVVLDRHYNSLAPYNSPELNIYAVRIGNTLSFRYALFESNKLVLRPRALDHPVEIIEISSPETQFDLIVGRVCFSLSEP
jgi:hypothetical protein